MQLIICGMNHHCDMQIQALTNECLRVYGIWAQIGCNGGKKTTKPEPEHELSLSNGD